MFEARGEAAADDLLRAALLTGTSGRRCLLQRAFSIFLSHPPGGDQTAQREGCTIEDVGETSTL
ncbi:hypothetical protein BU52_28930 [Streptomyces toyocaensis]|uniref:Uncharacterized protein n=1 Tax=Streptomyces toyocaensis TaxID=55952 RepID=A0A081XJL7_STRTO|nr:hypothetical protein BU52_28930 [Streptomyces toyocaensis]